MIGCGGALRATFGIPLVGLIAVMVVSPYVDLPLTTRPAAIRILRVVALCWAAAAGWHLPRQTERLSSEEAGLRGLHDGDLLEIDLRPPLLGDRFSRALLRP